MSRYYVLRAEWYCDVWLAEPLVAETAAVQLGSTVPVLLPRLTAAASAAAAATGPVLLVMVLIPSLTGKTLSRWRATPRA